MEKKQSESVENHVVDNSAMVVKSNRVVEASYTLTLNEQRVILSAISRINHNKKDITDTEMYEVTPADMEFFGVHKKTSYRELKSAVSKLYDRSINFKGGTRNAKIRWIQSASFGDAEGKVWIRFSRDIVPYLMNLSKEFTRYSLSEISQFTSVHAVRIYELIMQYKSVGCRRIKLSELRELLELRDKYPLFSSFRTRVLDESIKQITATSPYYVSYNTIKDGKTVIEIEFVFGKKVEEDNLIEEDSPEIDTIESLNLFEGLTEKQAVYFASLLCTDETAVGRSFCAKYGKGFSSYEAMKKSIAIKLQNPEYYSEFREWLIKVGFEEK